MAVCLVTGGAGFIGSHLVEALVARGDSVRVLDDFSTGTLDNLAAVRDQVGVTVTDLGDLDLLTQACAGVEHVFHFAGSPYGPLDRPDWNTGGWASATETLHVLIAAREAGVRRVVYASSGTVYGHQDALRLRETDPILPLSPYGFAKLSGEHHCVAFTSLYGLETVRLRYFNVFGPRQSPSRPNAAAIPAIVKAMFAGQSPVLLDNALDYQDFLYIDDAVHATLLAAELGRSGRAYNVARGRPANLLQVVATVNELLGTQIKPLCSELRPYDGLPRPVDICRAEAELGFCPGTDLRQGLARLIEHYAGASAVGTAGASGDPGRKGPHLFGAKRPPAPATGPGDSGASQQ